MDNLLGKTVHYKSQYDSSLLFPIDREEGRKAIGFPAETPLYGEDIWNAYELSWLNAKGKPQVAIAECRFAADTRNIIESKSFKLYLNSFNQTRVESKDKLCQMLERDLSAAAIGSVKVKLFSPAQWQAYQCELPTAILLDELDIEACDYHPRPDLLTVANTPPVSETLISHLLRSLCPVTGQPDWASIIIAYEGRQIDHPALLKYIISYREHQDFHEQCVEKIFKDITLNCAPDKLTVYARYLRRGGLDICPFRSSSSYFPIPNMRLARQ